MHKRYRIASPIRFFTFILILTLILVFGIASIVSSSHSQAASFNTYVQVVVEENDTLWSIAEDFSGSDQDIRDVVDEICDVNDISASDIQPGDLLFIPVSQ